MRVKDLNGKIHSWNLSVYVSDNKRQLRSSLHLKARELLQEYYRADMILEELTVPGEHLFLDFFLPSKKMVVEVQGPQHYQYTPHFHGIGPSGIKTFMEAKARDERKSEWCDINGFKLICLPFNESEEDWLRRIKG